MGKKVLNQAEPSVTRVKNHLIQDHVEKGLRIKDRDVKDHQIKDHDVKDLRIKGHDVKDLQIKGHDVKDRQIKDLDQMIGGHDVIVMVTGECGNMTSLRLSLRKK